MLLTQFKKDKIFCLSCVCGLFVLLDYRREFDVQTYERSRKMFIDHISPISAQSNLNMILNLMVTFKHYI